MTGKERIRTALSHKQPDKIPVDFGATAVSGMHVTAVAELRDHFGLEKRPVKVCEPFQMLGEVEPDLQDALGVDVVPLFSPSNLFGFRNENWKEFKAPWGQQLLVPGKFNTTVDANGDLLLYPEGDMTVGASGRMPVGGFFFDAINRQKPIDEDKLNPEDNLEEFKVLSDEEVAYYKREAERLSKTGKAVVTSVGATAMGDIALVTAPWLKNPKGIRDVEEWYVSTIARQDYIHKVFEKESEIGIENLKRVYAAVGEMVDAVFICGTDFGTQISSFCSVETFNELYAPYYKKMNDWVHKNTGWKTFKHSCGAIEKFMNPLIESGFDIINPVQCSATGMDPEHLKKEYGSKLTFWGGGVNTQHTLPFGMPMAVREEVLKRCEIFSWSGGFVFNSIHNVQANTPVENIIAMLNAIKEFNG
ncbi:MAG: methyltransferase [Fibrobacteres bacterium]|nr:methyltransferase [Fibrobacterota bacterium]